MPATAASAFYWASRINPGWADPLYARRAAILLSDKPRLLDYWNGVRRVERLPEMRHADSLYDRAVVKVSEVYSPADLAALLQGEPWRLRVLLAQQLLGARLLGRRAAIGAAPLLPLHACSPTRDTPLNFSSLVTA